MHSCFRSKASDSCFAAELHREGPRGMKNGWHGRNVWSLEPINPPLLFLHHYASTYQNSLAFGSTVVLTHRRSSEPVSDTVSHQRQQASFLVERIRRVVARVGYQLTSTRIQTIQTLTASVFPPMCAAFNAYVISRCLPAPIEIKTSCIRPSCQPTLHLQNRMNILDHRSKR